MKTNKILPIGLALSVFTLISSAGGCNKDSEVDLCTIASLEDNEVTESEEIQAALTEFATEVEDEILLEAIEKEENDAVDNYTAKVKFIKLQYKKDENDNRTVFRIKIDESKIYTDEVITYSKAYEYDCEKNRIGEELLEKSTIPIELYIP